MEKISVIIPVYNVEEYLEEAVNSIIKQTYKNLEIILVNDGSTDSSGQICDKCKNIDDRIIVIHQENRGLSGARNSGLKIATGKYLMFLDSDDLYEQNACEIMYNEIEKRNADYVIGNYINIDEDGTRWENPVFSTEKYSNMKLSIYDYDKSFYLMNSSVCNKIFRKSFIDSLDLKFVERLPAEDAIFTTYCFIKSSSVYYVEDVIYQYRQRYSNSISNSCSKKYFDGINKAYRIIYENFRDNDQLEYYRYFYAKSMNYIIYKFIDSTKITNEERIQVLEEMRWFYELAVEINIPTIMKSVRFLIDAIIKKDYDYALKYCEILSDVRKMMTKEQREIMSKPNAETYKTIANT